MDDIIHYANGLLQVTLVICGISIVNILVRLALKRKGYKINERGFR